MVSWGGLPPSGISVTRALPPEGGLGGFAPQESPLITRALPPQRPCLAPMPCPQFFFVQIFSSEFFRPNFFVRIFSSEFFRPNFFRPIFSSIRRPSSVVRGYGCTGGTVPSILGHRSHSHSDNHCSLASTAEPPTAHRHHQCTANGVLEIVVPREI